VRQRLQPVGWVRMRQAGGWIGGVPGGTCAKEGSDPDAEHRQRVVMRRETAVRTTCSGMHVGDA
jgi:DNA invertase Pin-like site-specific DNA recombinase